VIFFEGEIERVMLAKRKLFSFFVERRKLFSFVMKV